MEAEAGLYKDGQMGQHSQITLSYGTELWTRTEKMKSGSIRRRHNHGLKWAHHISWAGTVCPFAIYYWLGTIF